MSETYMYKVLVVEDEPTSTEIIRSQLEEKYLVTYATTKQQGLDLLKADKFDLLLLDVVLPDGNGLDICKEIKANHDRYGEIAIVIITGLNDPATEVIGLKLGANDYIDKPIHGAVLSARVELQIQLLRKTQLLAELARIDALTEVANRRAFDDYLEKSWNHALRISAPISLALIDVDFFKQYNDIYGHPAGDHCLKQVAQCMRACVKRGSDHIARIGGEEFAILLFDCELEHAQQVMKSIQDKFAELAIPHEGSALRDTVSLSIGVCTAYPDIDDREYYLAAADKLLYQAKKNGRNMVVADLFHRLEKS